MVIIKVVYRLVAALDVLLLCLFFMSCSLLIFIVNDICVLSDLS